MTSNSYSPESQPQEEDGEEGALLCGHNNDVRLKNSIHEFMAMYVPVLQVQLRALA